MKEYGLVLVCLSLSLIPIYSEEQTGGSSNLPPSHLQYTISKKSSISTIVPSNNTSSQENQLLETRLFKIGNSLFYQGNYEKAITYYDEALQINSTDINALYNKALALDYLNRTSEAITYYGKVLAINPNDTDTLNNIGLAIDTLGNHTGAIKYYDKVLSINPSDTDALYNKGLALQELGNKSQAIENYKAVLAVNPNDSNALNKLNLTYNNANQTVIAETQDTDQSISTIVGLFIVILVSLIIIDLIGKRAGRQTKFQNFYKAPIHVDADGSEKINQTENKQSKFYRAAIHVDADGSEKINQTENKQSKLETDEDEWKGI